VADAKGTDMKTYHRWSVCPTGWITTKVQMSEHRWVKVIPPPDGAERPLEEECSVCRLRRFRWVSTDLWRFEVDSISPLLVGSSCKSRVMWRALK
jgi:hypothetical protein